MSYQVQCRFQLHIMCLKSFIKFKPLQIFFLALKIRGTVKSKRSRSLSMKKTKISGKCSILSMYLWRIRRMVNWSPSPLDEEDDDTMKAHKRWLRNEWLKIKYLDIEGINEVTKRMELCFPYRRKEINSEVSLHYLKR